jgi:hypothetical protein
MTSRDRLVTCLAAWPALLLLFAPPASAQLKPGALRTGGEVHAASATVDGMTYRIRLQFFKIADSGSCWDSVGRDSAGRIYIAASTQRKTTYLWRLDPQGERIRYLGDLHSNVRYGGPEGGDSGKIHSSFVQWTDGGIYFPGHQGEGELRHGGHMWKYDLRRRGSLLPRSWSARSSISAPSDAPAARSKPCSAWPPNAPRLRRVKL